MKSQFELEWLGGSTEALLRKRRPKGEVLPWGTLTLDDFEPESVLDARKVWTNGTFTEYASAAAFSALTGALLECGAPIDLIATAADFVVDEMSHTEIASRLVMELGGAMPYLVDLDLVAPSTTEGASKIRRAAELVIKVSSVGEALSVPILAESWRGTDHPLVRGVIGLLLHDEGPHSKLSDWFFEWAEDRLDQSDRAHLAKVALDNIAVYAPLWRERSQAERASQKIGSIGFDLSRDNAWSRSK